MFHLYNLIEDLKRFFYSKILSYVVHQIKAESLLRDGQPVNFCQLAIRVHPNGRVEESCFSVILYS